jgi:hypothetical protein
MKGKVGTGKLIIDKINNKFDSTILSSYAKVCKSDRYKSQNKSNKPTNISERKINMNSMKMDSTRKRSESRNKYKQAYSLGMSRRKKNK